MKLMKMLFSLALSVRVVACAAMVTCSRLFSQMGCKSKSVKICVSHFPTLSSIRCLLLVKKRFYCQCPHGGLLQDRETLLCSVEIWGLYRKKMTRYPLPAFHKWEQGTYMQQVFISMGSLLFFCMLSVLFSFSKHKHTLLHTLYHKEMEQSKLRAGWVVYENF